MTDEEKEFHGLTRMEQLRIAENHIAKLEAQLAAQPKPATGGSNPYYEAHFGDEQHQPSCQSITSARGVGPFPCDCKPATGEWTVSIEDDAIAVNIGTEILRFDRLPGRVVLFVKLADAHNAALTAERDKRADWNVVIEDLERALAAEREKHKTLAHAFESERELRKRYEEQLTAERERVKIKNFEI